MYKRQVKRFLKFEKEVEPNQANQAEYGKLKPIFDQAYHCLEPLYKEDVYKRQPSISIR